MSHILKEQYFGDIRDFIKYALLREFALNGVKVGVCWLMTEDDTSSDGNKNAYLTDAKYRDIDPELFTALRILTPLRGIERLKAFEEADLIRGATYQTEIIPASPLERAAYFDETRASFADRELVFFDPDNGLTPPSTKQHSVKHVTAGECSGFLAAKLVYQHRPRFEKSADTVQRMMSSFPGQHVAALSEPDVTFCLATENKALSSHLERFANKWQQAQLSPTVSFAQAF